MKIKWLSIWILILIFPQAIFSQTKDFGMWFGLNAGYSINKKWEINLTANLRTFRNISKIEQSFLELGGSYKVNKTLSFAGSYRFIDYLESDSEYHLRHKWFADTKISVPLNDFSFSARFRLQIQSKTYLKNIDDRLSGYVGRIKLKVQYNIPKFPVNPYMSFETFSAIFEKSERVLGKIRFTTGVEYKIFKKQSIEAEYIFQRDYLPHVYDMNILSLTYNIKF
jgi:hypothetical protein